jgi:hypothetical protein
MPYLRGIAFYVLSRLKELLRCFTSSRWCFLGEQAFLMNLERMRLIGCMALKFLF